METVTEEVTELQMTPEEMAQRYKCLVDRNAKVSQLIGDIYQSIKTLRDEAAEIQKEISTLKAEYHKRTGCDLRKAVRHPAQAAVDRAHGALLSMIAYPNFLPIDHPHVALKLAIYKQAVLDHQRWKESQGAPPCVAEQDDAA